MKSELSEFEKCLDDEYYDCHDASFIERKVKATEWCLLVL